MTKIVKIEPCLFDTYLQVIKNSVGSKMFRNFYAKVNGKKKDVLNDGDLACAFYVSSILVQFGLIKKVHCTVGGTVFDLEQSGWRKITKPKVGAVLVWAEKFGTDGEVHKHIGFYLGNSEAVSNDSKKRQIAKHHFTYGEPGSRQFRLILEIWENPNFVLK